MRLGLLLFLSTIVASAQTLVWTPNTEPNLSGYKLYTFGPTNFVTTLPTSRTNYSLPALPPGEFHFLLTAFSPYGESPPAGPLFWTNSTPALTVIVHLQASANLTQWATIFSLTNYQPANTQAFYRAMLEIKR